MSKFTEQVETIYDIEEKVWKGPVRRPLYDRNCSFGYIAFEALRRRGNHMCLISDSENTRLTNNELRLLAIRIARSFKKFGIQQSDIIGIAGRNTTHLFAVMLACFFSGSAYHAINTNNDKETSKHLFDNTKPRIIFCDGQDLEKIRYASSDIKTRIFTLTNHCEDVSSILDLLEPTGDEHKYQPAVLESGTNQNLAILCSSGSTGPPKCATISHLHRIWDGTNFLTEDDVQYLIGSMDCLSAFCSMIGGIVHGATTVISEKPCSPEYFLKVVQKYKITFTVMLPTSIAVLVKCPLLTADKLESLKNFLYGGAKATLSAQHSLQNLLLNGRLINIYAFTEFNKMLSRNFYFSEKPSSSGLLMPGMKARIVDENGKNLGPNQIGEIICNHGEKWAGCYGDIDATKNMYDDESWFHTGDLGYFDDDCFLYIVDRKKQLLKYNGIQYYPNEIAEIISQMSDVKEVYVFGIFSELRGDMAAAAVVKIDGSTLTPEDVVSYVQAHVEADYMRLHGGCKFFEAMPKLPNGKIDRTTTIKTFFEL